MKPKPKTRYVLFWFKTNKGTSLKRVFKTSLSTPEVKDRLEDWIYNIYHDGSYSESVISYGYKFIQIPPTHVERLKRWRAICKRFDALQEQRSVIMATLSVDDLV